MELDQEYLSTRKATDTWQAAQLQAISAGTEGAGTLDQPKAELTIDANTSPGNDATMNDGKRVTDLKLAKPPTADTVPENVVAEPIASVEPKRKEFTVDTPDVQELRTQAREQLAKLSTGQTVLDEIGSAGRKVAEAIHPGIVTAGRAIGLDEEGADALATGFVEFIGGLPGQDEGETMAGIETALAALPMVGATLKAGKATVKSFRTIKPHVISKAESALNTLVSDYEKALQEFKESPDQAEGLYEALHGARERRDMLKNVHDLDDDTVRLIIETIDEDISQIQGRVVAAAESVDDELATEGNAAITARKLFGTEQPITGITSRDVEGASEAFRLSHIIDGLRAERAIYMAALRDSAQGRVASEFQKAVDILKSERGSFQPVPGGEDAAKAAPKAEPPQVPAVSPFAENFKKNAEDFGFRVDGFLDELTKQRRGPVLSDVKVQELANRTELTMAGLLELPPGTILNPEHTVKAKQLFKAGAKRMREAAQAVKESGGDPSTISEMFRSIGEMGVATTKMAGLYAESGRTTRLLNQKYPIQEAAEAMKRDPEFRIADAMIQQLYEFFAKAQAATGVNPGSMTVEKVADMVLSMKTEEEMAVFAKAISKPGWWDMFTEVWINGLLSGPVTHTTNMMSNAATLLWNIPERAMASGLSRGAIRPGEAQAMLGGIMESMGDAWALAWKAFKEEESQLGVGKIETPRRAITADALELTGVPGRAVDFLGNAIRLPGRFLLAGDDFFKSIAFRAELRALAKREAFKAINEGGLTGSAAVTKAKDIEARILANPPESIKDAAQEFASYVTFTRELGETGQKVQQLASTPVGRLILPFVRTPTNIFKFAGERTPFALASRAVRDELMAGGERQALALAKISLGSMTMGGIAMLAANGYVTGNGPKDPALREIKKATGWQPNSFKIGEQYVSYSRMEPIGSLFGMAADAADLMGQLDEMDGEELAAALTVAFARNASSKTFIKGLAETLHAVTSQDVKIVNNYLEKELPTLIPFSSLVKTVRNIEDPVMRDVDTILDAFRNKVPGFSTDLPPHRNLWGEPVLMEGALGPDFLSPLYTSTVKDDPVSTEIDRLQLPIRKPMRSIDGVKLDPWAYDAYVRLSGGLPTIRGMTLKEKLKDLMDSNLYARSSNEGKETLIGTVINDYRDRAVQILRSTSLSNEFLGEDFPDLMKQLSEREEARSNMFRGDSMTAPGGLTR